jgi:hypothetical protein
MPAPLVLSPPPPLCTQCGVRSARPHPIVGFWKTCARCNRQKNSPARLTRGRSGHRRRPAPCPICATPRTAPGPPQWSGCCSVRCAVQRLKTRTAATKTRVLAALGNRCACPGNPACFHCGPCPISHPDLLEIDHLDGSGARIRRPRFSRRPTTSTIATRWARYARDLDAGNHAMQLLCANCHRWVTVRRRSVSG